MAFAFQSLVYFLLHDELQLHSFSCKEHDSFLYGSIMQHCIHTHTHIYVHCPFIVDITGINIYVHFSTIC